jgi:hypothetical protein
MPLERRSRIPSRYNASNSSLRSLSLANLTCSLALDENIGRFALAIDYLRRHTREAGN